MPKIVSVILPTSGKHPSFFLDAVNSLLQQKYQSWEGIVVKNPDFDAESLIKVLHSPVYDKFKIVDAPKNCGVAIARNIGIENSIGSYIAYLDEDDLWSDEYLKLQVEGIEKTESDLVYCNYHVRIQKFSDTENKYSSHFISIPYNVNPFDRDVLLTEPFMQVSTVLHTKEITELLKFPDISEFSEWKFFLKASKMFKFQGVPYTLTTIQRRVDSTNNRYKFGNESLRNLYLIYKEFENELKDEKSKKIKDYIYSEFVKEYDLITKDEFEFMQTILVKRGFEFAYGYLKYLISINKIDSNICSLGKEICLMMEDKDMADDLSFLSLWYKGIEDDNYKDYIPKNFIRENGKWNASL